MSVASHISHIGSVRTELLDNSRFQPPSPCFMGFWRPQVPRRLKPLLSWLIYRSAESAAPPKNTLFARCNSGEHGEHGHTEEQLEENYSTVTDLARFLGWSTSQPRRTAM